MRKGFVWISGNGGWPKPTAAGSGDDMILKFTTAGKLVMQIGTRGQSTGNTDTANVHQPADVFVHAPTNELFVADGYGNQRVVVFDADSGKFKRMWGAFGNTPPAAMAPNPPTPQPEAGRPMAPPQFGLVHAVKVSRDGIVYVADRTYNRMQTFTTDGQVSAAGALASEGTRRAGPGRASRSRPTEAAVSLCRGFGTDARRDLRSRDDDADRHGRHARSEARRVRHRASHGRRLERQPLHRGDRHQSPRAEIRAAAIASVHGRQMTRRLLPDSMNLNDIRPLAVLRELFHQLLRLHHVLDGFCSLADGFAAVEPELEVAGAAAASRRLAIISTTSRFGFSCSPLPQKT